MEDAGLGRSIAAARAMSDSGPFLSFPPLEACGLTFKMYESEKTGLRAMLLETGEPLCSLHTSVTVRCG